MFELSGGINHAAAGGDHIIDDNDILACNVASEELVRHNRIGTSYDPGVIATLIKHAGIGTQDICKVDRTVKRSLVGRNDGQVFLVYNQVIYIIKKCF